MMGSYIFGFYFTFIFNCEIPALSFYCLIQKCRDKMHQICVILFIVLNVIVQGYFTMSLTSVVYAMFSCMTIHSICGVWVACSLA